MNSDILILLYSILVVLFAGYVRGFSGFGFSIIVVICLSLVYPPVSIVPVIFLLESFASFWLIPKIWREVDWNSLRWLLVGILFGTPLGVYALASIPERPMKIAIALLIIVLVSLLSRGGQLKKMPGKAVTLLTGFFSGLINGSASIGGPPVILFYLSSPAGVGTSRASLIALFFVTDILALGFCALNDLLTVDILTTTGILTPSLVLGLAVGARTFAKTDPEPFRKKILILLLCISVITLIQTV